MKRLVDEENRPGTAEERLTELVRAVPKFQPAPFRRQRVLAQLMRPQARVRRVFRASLAAAFALGTAAVAAAAIERSWVRHEPAVAPRAAAAQTPPPATAPRSALAGIDETASVEPAAPAAETPARLPYAPKSNPKRSGGADTRLVTRARPRGEEDPARVLDAIRTLRNGGDATRAAALLDEYLQGHPNGVLAEDALALSIEAADARHDRRAAADYADRYLRQFPGGRFRVIAAQAVQRGEP